MAACKAMVAAMEQLGVAVDGGKDSLSMAARVGKDTVMAPGGSWGQGSRGHQGLWGVEGYGDIGGYRGLWGCGDSAWWREWEATPSWRPVGHGVRGHQGLWGVRGCGVIGVMGLWGLSMAV